MFFNYIYKYYEPLLYKFTNNITYKNDYYKDNLVKDNLIKDNLVKDTNDYLIIFN